MSTISDAITATAKDVAASLADLDIDLDGSGTSLTGLDAAMERIWGDAAPEEDVFDGMVWGYGCYVADVVQRHHVGEWQRSEDVGYDFVIADGDAVANPWVWVEKRFRHGESLASQYRAFFRRSGAPAG